MAHTERIIVLVDMDCFYCQVEEKLNPVLAGKPIAVVQYNAWRGGGIIAVNYPARDKGVTRHMRGDEAKKECPEIELVRVPQVRGKADLTKYREAGKRVADVLQTFTSLLERASVDEAYLDITDLVTKKIEQNLEKIKLESVKNTFVVGSELEDFLHNVHNSREYSECNFKLAVGGLITEEIRAEVYNKTGYRCSAGIAHNKILAKLVCGLHKPNKQTILPQDAVPHLFLNTPIRKIKSLGGKFGNILAEKLKITNVGELIQFSERDLAKRFDEKTANWLYNIARGIDNEPVTTKLVSKSIGCCKKFPGRTALVTPESVVHWLNELAVEIAERLEKDMEENNRRAKQMIVSFAQDINKKEISSSRTHPLNSYESSKIAQDALGIIKKYCMKSDGNYNVKFLGLSVGNFDDVKNVREITSFFKTGQGTKTLLETSSSEKQEKVSIGQSTENNNSLLEVLAKGLQQSQYESVEEPNEPELDINASVYSATTEEMDEDPEELIYYHDVFPEKCDLGSPIRKNPQKIINASNCCENSERSSDCSKIVGEVKPPSVSFFARYFESESSRVCVTNTAGGKIINSSNCSEDSITDELITDNRSSNVSEVRPPSTSFFARYFENEGSNPGCSANTVERNFNTSKVLEDEHAESEESLPEPPVDQQKFVDVNLSEATDSLHEICSECNKKILKMDFMSHMDYHFALKMVREEAHLFKPTNKSPILGKETKVEKKSRRKSPCGKSEAMSSFLKRGNDARIDENTEVLSDNLSKNLPVLSKKAKVEKKSSVKSKRKPPVVKSEAILSFLKKDNDAKLDENTDVCSECSKKIRLVDIASHMDYHAAKKLHVELNSVKTNRTTNNLLKDKKHDNQISISSFFKPS